MPLINAEAGDAEVDPPPAPAGEEKESVAIWPGKWRSLFFAPAFIILVFFILVFTYADTFFQTPHIEWGDLAVNALQIEEAKQGQALVGHYSRWGFNHPGPAFFYWYALGDLLLRDTFALVPSAYNAHVLAGLLLQTTLLLIPIWLIAHHLKNGVVIPLFIFLAALHFAAAGNDIYSIWPPDTLAIPFYSFLVGCVLLSLGNGIALPLVCLAGGLLVHNYIAQPLFVIPLFLFAYMGLLFSRKQEQNYPIFWRGVRAFPRQHLLGGLIIIVFILPIALDAIQGPESNLQRIGAYLQNREEAGKTAFQSGLFAAATFFYEQDPDVYAQISDPAAGAAGADVGFLRKHADKIGLWLLALLLPIIYIWFWPARWPSPPNQKIRRLVKRFYIILVITLPLILFWGMLQPGTLEPFTSYFYYGVTLFLFTILVIALGEILAPHFSRLTWMILLGFSLFVLAVVFKSQPITATVWADRSLLDARGLNHSAQQTTRYLAFNRELWPVAAALALDMHRHDIDFRVAPEWGHVFGKTFALNGQSEDSHNFAVWHLLPEDKLSPATIPIPNTPAGLLLTSDHLSPIRPERDEIVFAAGGNSYLYEGIGWGGAEALYTWSAAESTTLLFSALPAGQDVCLLVTGGPYLGKDGTQLEDQTVIVYYNGDYIDTLRWEEEKTNMLKIPQEMWNREEAGILAFDFLQALAPITVDDVPDRRLLSVAFSQISFSTCP